MTNEIFLKNIDVLRGDKKISDFEGELGVSTGYFSRLSKTPKSFPGTELLLKLSNISGMSIDLLLLFEIDRMNEDEQNLINFLHRLRNETILGTRRWNVKKGVLPRLSRVSLQAGGIFHRPPETRRNGLPIESEIGDGRIIEVLPIIITDERYNSKYYGIEMYFEDEKEKIPLCASYNVHQAVQSKLFELMYVAQIGSCGMQIEQKARDFINDYLGA